jgi:hypothetical protein
MEFRDYAAREASALMARLLASRSEASIQQIRTLRDAFDAAARAAEAEAELTPQVDADLQELVRRLNNAATAAVRATAQRIQEEAAAALAAVQGDLDAERARSGEVAALLGEAQEQIESLRTELRNETHRASIAERDLESARALYQEVDAARISAETATHQEAQARAGLEDELRESRGLLDAALSEAASLNAQLEAEATDKRRILAALTAARETHEQLSATRDAAETAAHDRELARAALEDELQGLRHSLEDSIAEAARLSVQRADLESALDAAEAQSRDQAQAASGADRELLHLRRSLDDSIAESARLTVHLEQAAVEKGGLEAAVSALRAERDELRTQYAGVEAERDVNRASVLSLESTQLEQAAKIRDLESSLDAAMHAESSVRAEVAGSEAAIAGSRAEINFLHNEVDRLASLLDAAVLAADELAASPSVTDLLAALVRQLSGVYSRVALFRLKGNRLEGEQQIGFDLSTDVTKLVIPLSVDSLIARAAASGTVESLTGIELDDSRHAPFGTSASAAMAIPIVVRKDTLAVLYAEEPGDPSSAGEAVAPIAQHATFAKLLVRHAVAMLMRLTEELKALTDLREYASMLLQEAEQMYVADAEAGKPEDELRRRLTDTIECARQLFGQRASMDGPAASSLLDDEIVATIESQAGTPFARDLAAAAGESERAGRTAEAS